MSGHFLAMMGPSFAGKSTFIRYLLAERDDFTVAPLMTTRQPRTGESGDATMGFASEEQVDQLQELGWFVDTVGPARYALDLNAAQSLSRHRHVLLGVAPPTLQKLRHRLPDVKLVLFWPADFDRMQDELAASSERPPAEREDRIRRNEALRAQPPFADVRLIVDRVSEQDRPQLHKALADELSRRLQQLPPLGADH